MTTTDSVPASSRCRRRGRPYPAVPEPVRWDCAARTLEVGTRQGCTHVEVGDNTPDAVAALPADMGRELGSSWAYAADTVRYAAVDPFEDHRDTEHA